MDTVKTELFVLEWSQKYSSFHIQAARHMLSRHREAYRDNRPLNDYHVLHIGTMDECSAMATACRKTLEQRHQAIHEAVEVI